jgi:hypothetical protein
VNKFWNQTADANRLVMALTAIGVIVVLVGGLVIGTRLLDDDKSSALDESKSAVVEPHLEETTTTVPPTTAPPVTTPTGLTRQQVENPEGSMLDPYQLAYAFNQGNSGLNGVTYQRATDVAARFAEASATGKGAAEFKAYFDAQPADAWVNDYAMVYATTSKTQDETLLKATVWFTGKEKISGLPMRQVKHVFLLKRDSATSLNIQPYDIGNGFYDDPELGIHVTG